jgi:hypothetical protein
MLSGWYKVLIPVNLMRAFRQGGMDRLGTQRPRNSLAQMYTARWQAKSGNARHRKTVSALLGNDSSTKFASMLPSIFIHIFLKIKRQYFGLCF